MVKNILSYLILLLVALVIISIGFLVVFGKRIFTLEDSGVVTLVKTAPVEQVIEGKEYLIRLYHKAHALSNDYLYIAAVDREGRIHYTCDVTETGASPDTAEIVFRKDGMIEIHYTNIWGDGKQMKADTVIFKPRWRRVNDLK